MKNDKIKIFVTITSFLSIIILLIGTTFSYFTISAKSEANALSVTAADVRVNLAVSELYPSLSLIPLKDELINKAYNKECVDDLGRGACLAYTLELVNYSKEQNILGIIDFTINKMENLSYMVLDDKGNTYLDVTHIDSKNSTSLSFGDAFKLGDGTVNATSKKFILLVWLTDTNAPQNETDAAGDFKAKVTFSSVTGGKLTGTVQGMESDVEGTSVID